MPIYVTLIKLTDQGREDVGKHVAAAGSDTMRIASTSRRIPQRTLGLTAPATDGQHRVGEGLGGFLRQVVADGGTEDAPLLPAGEARAGIGRCGRLAEDAVVVAVERDGRDRDDRLRGQTRLDRGHGRIAIDQRVAVAVRMEDHRHEVRVVEGRRGAVVGRVIEAPSRRPQPPQEAAQLAPVLLEPAPAALAVEVVLYQ